MNRIPTIACIGEVMIEMVTKSECQAKIGVAGDTYNTAVYLKQLTKNKPITVTYVTALGEDTFSNRILDRLTSYGIDTSAVEKRTDRMPGLYAIETDENGERSFVYWRGQSAARTLFQQNMEQAFEKLSSFDLLYLSGISVAILPSSTRNALFEFLNDYRSKGGKVVFDSNYRPRLWEDLETARDVTAKMWALCDIALPSVDDEMELFGDTDEKSVIARLKNLGVSFGALKRGKAGPVSLGEDSSEQAFAPISKIVDSTAAGDSFNAGFLQAYMNGQSVADALQSGHDTASRVIQAHGAIVDLN